MRLWTVQSQEVYETWRKGGTFRTDPALVGDGFLPAYSWMIRQMRLRLPEPAAECRFPVWAWFQAINSRHKRPDLRQAGLLPSGQAGVLLTLEIERRLVLLSDFDLWHYVLNDAYLPACEEDFAEVSVSRRQRSWTRIFDLDFTAAGIADAYQEKTIQAVFWELAAFQVVGMQKFTAR